MRIARTIESFYPFVSGPANQAFQISRRIKSSIFTTFYKAEKARTMEIFDEIKIKRHKIKWRFMKFLYTPSMRRSLLKFMPDIIHAHNYRSYQTHLSYKLAKKLKIPFIINSHGSLLGYETIVKGTQQIPYKVFDIFGKKAVIDADAVIVSSKQEHGEALKFGVSSKRLHIIPMGIDISDYDIKRQRTDQKIRLLFVGRICRDRNLVPIINAMNLLDDRYELRIVGGEVKRSDAEKSGHLKELKRLAQGLDVTFTGPIYGTQLRQEYAEADVFVYTSLWENFGQTILEAGAAGLPLITTRVGIACEIVNDDTGFLVQTNNPKQIAESVRKMTKSKRDFYGKNIRDMIKRDFCWDSIISRYRDIYEGCING